MAAMDPRLDFESERVSLGYFSAVNLGAPVIAALIYHRGLNFEARIRRVPVVFAGKQARRWIRHVRIRMKTYHLSCFFGLFFLTDFCIARGGR